MRQIIDKLFYLNAWSIGWRQINNNSGLPIENIVKYQTISVNDSWYYADPFIIECDDGIYLFVESMFRYRGKGTISVAKLEGQRFGEFREVLNEPFHLSYPNVFQYRNQFFMIPETSEVQQIRLYKATDFPWKWELDSILLDDGNAWVDSSLQIMDDEYYLIGFYKNSEGKTVKRFRVNMESRQLIIADLNGLHAERPAGNCFSVENDELRPVQKCEDYYGQGIMMYKFNSSGEEKLLGEIKPENMMLEPVVHNLTGTHTINRSEHYEVVDFRFNRFCLTKRWIWLCNTLSKRRS